MSKEISNFDTEKDIQDFDPQMETTKKNIPPKISKLVAIFLRILQKIFSIKF